MDIMEWYGYLPKNYTFEDYHRDVQKRQQENQNSDRNRKETDDLHNEDQEGRVS